MVPQRRESGWPDGLAARAYNHWKAGDGIAGPTMPANRFNGFTELGVGIGLRVPHYRHILSKKPLVDWFEVISENYMVDAGRPLAVLDQIAEQYQIVQHGVAMYFGTG